jgi:hypothetical protein
MEPTLVDAVRTSVRRQVRAALERNGVIDNSLLECPRCGDRIISLAVPVSYALDGSEKMCRPCRAQIELSSDPMVDLGGEG